MENEKEASMLQKIISVPSLSVVLVKSESVNETKYGKSVKSELITVSRDVVIFFLYSHESLYQASVAFASKSDGGWKRSEHIANNTMKR